MKFKTLNLNEFTFPRVYGLVFGLSPVTLIGYPDRCKGRGKGFISAHSLEIQSFVGRTSEQRDLEATDHLTPITRKLKVMDSDTQLISPFSIVQESTPGNGAAHL